MEVTSLLGTPLEHHRRLSMETTSLLGTPLGHHRRLSIETTSVVRTPLGHHRRLSMEVTSVLRTSSVHHIRRRLYIDTTSILRTPLGPGIGSCIHIELLLVHNSWATLMCCNLGHPFQRKMLLSTRKLHYSPSGQQSLTHLIPPSMMSSSILCTLS